MKKIYSNFLWVCGLCVCVYQQMRQSNEWVILSIHLMFLQSFCFSMDRKSWTNSNNEYQNKNKKCCVWKIDWKIYIIKSIHKICCLILYNNKNENNSALMMKNWCRISIRDLLKRRQSGIYILINLFRLDKWIGLASRILNLFISLIRWHVLPCCVSTFG